VRVRVCEKKSVTLLTSLENLKNDHDV
jgi:hypothetical protein